MGQKRSPDVPSASAVFVANLLENTASERTHRADTEKHCHHIGSSRGQSVSHLLYRLS